MWLVVEHTELIGFSELQFVGFYALQSVFLLFHSELSIFCKQCVRRSVSVCVCLYLFVSVGLDVYM